MGRKEQVSNVDKYLEEAYTTLVVNDFYGVNGDTAAVVQHLAKDMGLSPKRVAHVVAKLVEDNYLMYDRTLSCSAFVVKHSMENVPDNFILPIPNENNRVPFIISYVSRVIDNDITTYRVFGTLNNVEVSYVAESEEVTQKYSTKYAGKNCCTVGELKSGYVIYTELNERGRLSSFYLISR